MIFSEKQKSFPITREQVWNAFKQVRSNGGSSGVDGITINDVSTKVVKYLYPLWNRMSSGSYFPKPVRQTLIPKAGGKTRALGIPTVVDRVAQQVIADELQMIVNHQFSVNSFGYRPEVGAHQAIEQCRIHCMQYSWVVDLDIKGFFDNIDHVLLMKAVRTFTQKPHIILYIERWLKAPIQLPDGTLKESQGKGTPQGGVISPVLANIFLHFVFDKWLEIHEPRAKFERYADDIVIHCYTEQQAKIIMSKIQRRLHECKLELSKEKSKIVYCRRNQINRPKDKPEHQKFDFLGYTFKSRMIKTTKGKWQMSVTPSISQKSSSKIVDTIKKLRLHRMVHLNIHQLANVINDKARGWIHYYGKFRKSALRKVFRELNMRLARWVRNKYRKFRNKHWYHSYIWLKHFAQNFKNTFVHWQDGFIP
jgi:RNA-directed DNA polymerase